MTTPPGPELPPFVGSAVTDVAVIGAGIAGLSTALHLAEAGISVTVLEAEHAGGGATGRSGGLVAPDFVRHTPAEAEALFPGEPGRRLVHLVGSSAARCFEIIDRHGLDCHDRRAGFWAPAHSRESVDSLRDRAAQWSERGFNVRFAGADETADRLGTDYYCGALVYSDGGALNPLAFSREMAAAAIRHGAAIHAGSRVGSVARTASGWRIETPEGRLDARRVVFAANGGNSELHPKLRKTTLPLDVIEYATEPLSPDQRAGILKDGVSFTDKKPYIFTARFDAEHRLIAAFPDYPARRSEIALKQEAHTRIGRHFPALAGLDVQYLWPGRAWINSDLMPRLYEVDRDAIAVQACNGRGIAANAALGAELGRALASNDFSDLSVSLQSPRPVRGYTIARYLPALIMFLAQARNRLSRLLGR